MKKTKLMKVYLNNHELIKKISVSGNSTTLLKEIAGRRSGYITSHQLSELKNISIQNASTLLSKLFMKDYLTRSEYKHESGGVEYFYEINFKLRGVFKK